MRSPTAWADYVNLDTSPLQAFITYLAGANVFCAAQGEDLVEGESESRPAEPCCSAVVDGPHERQSPRANQLHEEDPGYQRQAIQYGALWSLGVLQQSSHQESLETPTKVGNER